MSEEEALNSALGIRDISQRRSGEEEWALRVQGQVDLRRV